MVPQRCHNEIQNEKYQKNNIKKSIKNKKQKKNKNEQENKENKKK